MEQKPPVRPTSPIAVAEHCGIYDNHLQNSLLDSKNASSLQNSQIQANSQGRRRDLSNEKIYTKIGLRQNSSESAAKRAAALQSSTLSQKQPTIEESTTKMESMNWPLPQNVEVPPSDMHRGNGVYGVQEAPDQKNSMENELMNLQKKIMDLESKLNYGNAKTLLDQKQIVPKPLGPI